MCNPCVSLKSQRAFRSHAIREYLAARRVGRVAPIGLAEPSWSLASKAGALSTIEE